jgi:GT2 family glycosyltransferase
MKYPKACVVVCTKNRETELRTCLESVQRQTVPHPVVVVDASDTDATRLLCADLSQSFSASLRHLPTSAGLPKQRNLAVTELGTDFDIVHFIDDDVTLADDYLEEILETFAADEACQIGGVGGYEVRSATRPLRALPRLFLLDSARGGTVLRSGMNVNVRALPSPREVDWLPGFSMSFRAQVFEAHLFNENLTGYALGEDVEFSFRVAQTWRLIVTPYARITHHKSGTARLSAAELVRQHIENRYSWVRRFRPYGLSFAAFWWSILGAILITLGSAVRKRDVVQARSALVMCVASFRILRGDQARN